MTDLDTSPLMHAAYVLAREFGWRPDELASMTAAQISAYLELIDKDVDGRGG